MAIATKEDRLAGSEAIRESDGSGLSLSRIIYCDGLEPKRRPPKPILNQAAVLILT